MPDEPLVSVVIPTHQRRSALRRALDSLAAQTVPAEDYEVIVSVDGSTDGTSEMLAALPVPYALRIVSGPRRGRAVACNSALALARGDVLVVLDDDMQVVPNFIDRHRRHHPPGSRVCVLGAVPILLTDGSPHAARYVRAKFDAHLARLAKPDHVYAVRDFYSGNASLRADVLQEVGRFDESFELYGNEDVELSLRLRGAGVTLRYDVGALAHQEYDKDLRGLARDTLAKGRTTVLLMSRHPAALGVSRLALPREGSRAWLATRAVLLALTRRCPDLPAVIFAAAQLLERLGLWRRPLFYRAVLDYAFWAGVDAELSGVAPEALAALGAGLRRGPIDVLRQG